MSFSQTLISSIKGMFPGFLIWAVLPMIPFIIAEQRWPVGEAPRWREYGTNVLISLSTAFLSLPLGIAAGLWSGQLRHLLPWKPISFRFHSIGAVPVVGPVLEILAMIFVPLIIRLALSPQCGFASTLEGNLLTAADQKAKLRLVAEVAAEVWGSNRLAVT